MGKDKTKTETIEVVEGNEEKLGFFAATKQGIVKHHKKIIAFVAIAIGALLAGAALASGKDDKDDDLDDLFDEARRLEDHPEPTTEEAETETVETETMSE